MAEVRTYVSPENVEINYSAISWEWAPYLTYTPLHAQVQDRSPLLLRHTERDEPLSNISAQRSAIVQVRKFSPRGLEHFEERVEGETSAILDDERVIRPRSHAAKVCYSLLDEGDALEAAHWKMKKIIANLCGVRKGKLDNYSSE